MAIQAGGPSIYLSDNSYPPADTSNSSLDIPPSCPQDMYERSYLAKVERPAQAAPQSASGPRPPRYRLPLRLIADCGFRLRPDQNVCTYNDSRLPTRSELMRAHPAYDPEMLVGSWISQVSCRDRCLVGNTPAAFTPLST